jgi:hypothetical protein
MLKKAIGNILNRGKNKPQAIQCLWNSDWEYIGLSIELVFKEAKGYSKKKLIELEYTDFNSHEALVKEANRIGKKYAEKYDVELYFPSPDKWSRDCPNWWKISNSPKCKDCNIPIKIPESKYLSKEVCYPCQLTRDSNEKIINETPYDDGVSMFLSKNNDLIKLGYCSKFEMFPIASFIEYKVNIEVMRRGINVIIIHSLEIKKLIQDLEHKIDKEILQYEIPKIDKRMSKFVATRKMLYKGKEYELMNRFNSLHENLKELISSLNTAKKAIKENYEYKIYFKKGITHRDDSILRFINYPQKGETIIEELVQRYKGVLSKKDIEKSLNKLVRINCISFNKKKIEITKKAKKIM